MTKGSYAVGENSNNPPPKDTSFRSFICILLIFLAICLIILLATINWNKSGDGQNGKEDEVEVLVNEGNEPDKKFDKILAENRTTHKAIERTTPKRFTTHSASHSTTSLPTTRIFVFGRSTTSSPERFTTRPPFYWITSWFTTKTTPIETIYSTDSTRSTTSLPTTTTFVREGSRETSSGRFTTRLPYYWIKWVTGAWPTTETTPTETTTSIRFTTSSPTTKIIVPEISTSADLEWTDQSRLGPKIVSDPVYVTTEENTIAQTSPEWSFSTSPKELGGSGVSEHSSERSAFETERTESTTNLLLTTLVKSASENVEEQLTEKLSNTTESVILLSDNNSTESSYSSSETYKNVTLRTTISRSTLSALPSYKTIVESSTEARVVEERLPTHGNITASELVTEVTNDLSSSQPNGTTDVPEDQSTPANNASELRQLRMVLTPSSTTRVPRSVCRRAVCNEAATHILSLMNHSATPCEDFYDFACGGVYRVTEEVDSSKEFLVQLDNKNGVKHLEDFQKFYYSCLDYENDFKYKERLRIVDELVNSVGHFQFQNDSEPLEYTFTDLVSKLILRQAMPLFDVTVDVDRQSSNLILQLTLPEMSFLETSLKGWSSFASHRQKCLNKQKSQLKGSFINLQRVYELYDMCSQDYQDYINSVDEVLQELDSFSNLTAFEKHQEIKDIRFQIEFEVSNKISEYLSPGDILSRFVDKDYDVRRISDLERQYPVLEWMKLFENLTGRQLLPNTTVQVYFGRYFNEIFSSLGKIDLRLLNNVFLSIYAYDLFVNTVVPKVTGNREGYCLDLSKKLMPDVWASLAKTTLSPTEEEYQNRMVTDLFELLKNNLCKSLQEAEWLDDQTKIPFLKKCNNLSLTLFTPPDEDFLLASYEELNVTSNYQTNLIDLLVHFRRSVYSTVGTQFSSKTIFSYFLDPMSRKALSAYATNLIAVPSGLMQKAPKGLPQYLTLARVGLNLARQMARHFDPTGLKYWTRLSSSAKAAYSNLLTTMENGMVYSSPRLFHHKNISFQHNGSLSVNERIVDNAAFRLVLDSFSLSKPEDEDLPWISSTYSDEEIFFIVAAQEYCQRSTILDFMVDVTEGRHLPGVLRVENIMINSQQFSEKFSCADGSGMNPQLDKIQFPYLPPGEDYGYDGLED